MVKLYFQRKLVSSFRFCTWSSISCTDVDQILKLRENMDNIIHLNQCKNMPTPFPACLENVFPHSTWNEKNAPTIAIHHFS